MFNLVSFLIVDGTTIFMAPQTGGQHLLVALTMLIMSCYGGGSFVVMPRKKYLSLFVLCFDATNRIGGSHQKVRTTKRRTQRQSYKEEEKFSIDHHGSKKNVNDGATNASLSTKSFATMVLIFHGATNSLILFYVVVDSLRLIPVKYKPFTS